MPPSDVLVLCYHAVSDRWRSGLAVTPGRLAHELDRILARGYVGATFTEAVRARPARKTLVVSFDDAYRSTLLAAPVLAERGIPGTVFAPTGFVGVDGPMRWPGIEQWADGEHRDELLCMNWDELSALAAEGWEVGSHTVSHPTLTELDPTRLAEELGRSREQLEDGLGRPCTSVAYPYGRWDDRVAAAADEAGYLAGCTLSRWPHRARALAWPRVGSYGDQGRFFGLKTSVPLRRGVSLLRRG